MPTNQFIVGNNGPNPLAGGGGKSIIFGRPAYQDGVRHIVGDQRGVPDISMSGACNGAADMYQSFKGQAAGWYPTCGTSEATPEFAGIVALADQVARHPLGLINPDLYLLLARLAPGDHGHHQWQQHGVVPPGRAAAHRARVRRAAGLRPRIRGGHRRCQVLVPELASAAAATGAAGSGGASHLSDAAGQSGQDRRPPRQLAARATRAC